MAITNSPHGKHGLVVVSIFSQASKSESPFLRSPKNSHIADMLRQNCMRKISLVDGVHWTVCI